MPSLELNSGDTAWILTSAALVLLMTPGLALFYGGMVRAKSVLNMMMMSFGALALISVLWVLYGYSIAFGNDVTGVGLLGNPTEYLGLKGLMADTDATCPAMAFVAFQAVFAIITVALISGAIADRAKFGTWMIFAGIWATIVYFPVAHWVFDFTLTATTAWSPTPAAGSPTSSARSTSPVAPRCTSTPVPRAWPWPWCSASASAGRKDPMRPHNLTLVMLGAGLLWFGWFGFNAGSALAAGNTASVVWVNTMVATGAACLGWLLTERIRDGHATSLGAASGVVAGLVAITPSCSSVSPVGAIILGAIAGVLCALAVGLKYRFGYDDSLDVVGVHLVGGLWGTLAVGLSWPPGAGRDRLRAQRPVLRRRRRPAVAQAVGAFAVLIYQLRAHLAHRARSCRRPSASGSPRRKRSRASTASEHAETGYDLGTLGARPRGCPSAARAAARR